MSDSLPGSLAHSFLLTHFVAQDSHKFSSPASDSQELGYFHNSHTGALPAQGARQVRRLLEFTQCPGMAACPSTPHGRPPRVRRPGQPGLLTATAAKPDNRQDAQDTQEGRTIPTYCYKTKEALNPRALALGLVLSSPWPHSP